MAMRPRVKKCPLAFLFLLRLNDHPFSRRCVAWRTANGLPAAMLGASTLPRRFFQFPFMTHVLDKPSYSRRITIRFTARYKNCNSHTPDAPSGALAGRWWKPAKLHFPWGPTTLPVLLLGVINSYWSSDSSCWNQCWDLSDWVQRLSNKMRRCRGAGLYSWMTSVEYFHLSRCLHSHRNMLQI